MSKKDKKEFPLIEFVGMWLIILFGFLAIPDFSFTLKLIFIGVGTVGVVLFGIFYNSHLESKPIKPNNFKQQKGKPVKNSKGSNYSPFGFVVYCINVVVGLYIGITSWEYLTYNNVPIITYNDLIAIFFFVWAGVSSIIAIWFLYHLRST